MLLIIFSNWFHCHMLTIVFQCPCLRCVLSCHQLIYKCIASFYYLCYLLNLSFLNFFVKDFLVFRVFSSLACSFCCLGYVEFFIGRWLNQDVLWFFGGWHDVDDFFNCLRFDNFTGFLRLDFRVESIELRMVEKRCISGEKQWKSIF